jgi:transcriptional regulator with GAF, ATPase, and Fis domain
VRELENVIERAVILNATEMLEIGPELLPDMTPAIDESTISSAATSRSTGLKDVEREHIVSVLNSCNWVIEGERGAAKTLNMHPNTLRSRMKKMGLSRPAHEIS